MTLLEDRAVVRTDEAVPAHASSSWSTWRFAARLARREVRRRPGRTLLVALLVAVPVVAMTVGSVVYRTANDDWSESFARRNGTADLAVSLWSGRPISPGLVPAGSRTVEFAGLYSNIEPVSPLGVDDPYVWFSDLPLGDPLTDGIVEVFDGRAPLAAGEILLGRREADVFGVDIGSTLRLERPSGDWQVVGIGRLTNDHSQGLMVVAGFDRDRIRAEWAESRLLVELPEGFEDAETAGTISGQAGPAYTVENRWDPPSVRRIDKVAVLAWGWVAGVLALVAVGIVIAAAFATSARRQLVTIGQLSSNGAPARLVRRTLALQGSWTGVLGAAAGLVLGGVGLVFLRPVAERVVDHSLGGYQVVPFDLAVIGLTAIVAATVAAAVPARTASHVPVLSALAGRQPLRAPSRRLVPIGVGLFLGGLGLLFVAATGARTSTGGTDTFAFVALLGAVAVVFGTCCATPLLVEAVGRVGGRFGSGSWRLATRSTARARSRSAGVVTAVAVAGAFAVAGATFAAMLVDSKTNPEDTFPRDVVRLEQWSDWYSETAGEGATEFDPPPLSPLAIAPDVRAEIDLLVPDARWEPVRAAGTDPRPFDPESGPEANQSTAQETIVSDPFVATIADPAVLAVVGLSVDDRALLDEVDLLFLQPLFVATGSVANANEVTYTDERGDITVTVAEATGTSTGQFSVLISPERADALGFDVVTNGAILHNPTDLTRGQRTGLQRTAGAQVGSQSAFVEPGDPPTVEPDVINPHSGMTFWMTWIDDPLPMALINGLIVAAAVLLTLLVVAIGLSLSATESRDERDVLVAVGAPPRTLSRVAGAKALVLAATGVALAVPTGYVPTWVLYRTLDQGRVPFPWLTVGLILVVVPLVAGVAAWAASGIARRVRPVRMSTLAAD